MKISLTLAALALAAGIAAAPAAADADDLTNVEVAAQQDSSPATDFYRVEIPEPASGGQGPWDFVQDFDNNPLTPDTFSYDDGLSDSSRAMLTAP